MRAFTVIVRGRTVEYYVGDNGIFSTEVAGHVYKADTLAKLKNQIDTQLKKKPLNVPFVHMDYGYHDDSPKFESGTILSRHSSNGNLMVKYGASPIVQYKNYRGEMLRGNADVEKLKALHAKLHLARKVFQSAVESMKLDASKLGRDEE